MKKIPAQPNLTISNLPTRKGYFTTKRQRPPKEPETDATIPEATRRMRAMDVLKKGGANNSTNVEGTNHLRIKAR